MTDQERALLTVVTWWRRFSLDRVLLVIVAALHALAAVTLVLAPDAQLFTQGTRPVFALFRPEVWAVAFLIGAGSTASLLQRVTAGRQLVAWVMVIATQAVWLTASFMAIGHGEGSAMAVVFLTAVLAFTVTTAAATFADWLTGPR